MNLPQRIIDKISVEAPGCWMWTAAPSTGGYGACYCPTRRTMQSAHKVVWEILVGPVEEGFDLDHLCRRRLCCNPDHLEPVTRRVNLNRGAGPKLWSARLCSAPPVRDAGGRWLTTARGA